MNSKGKIDLNRDELFLHFRSFQFNWTIHLQDAYDLGYFGSPWQQLEHFQLLRPWLKIYLVLW
jgi:hypothetical protein